MKHAAALVVALTIAGNPAISAAACAWQCFEAAAQTSRTACQHHLATHRVQNAYADCDPLLAASPYITEDSQRSHVAVATSTPPPFTVRAPGEARLVSVRDAAPFLLPGSASPLVLRL